MGLVELDRYENDMLVRRKQIFDLYSELLKEFSWAILPIYITEVKTSSFHVYLLRIKGASENERDSIISEIFQRQVAVNVHFVPLPMMTYYKNLGYSINDFPVTFSLYQNEISLPVYYNLSDEQIYEVIKAVAESVSKVFNIK